MVQLSEREQIDALRECLLTDNTLYDKQLSDAFLLKFLRARDGDVTATHQLLSGYFDMRAKQPELFNFASDMVDKLHGKLMWRIMDPLPSGEWRLLRNDYVTSHLAGEGMVIVSPRNWNASEHKLRDHLAGAVPFFENAVLDEDVQKKGFIEVIDATGMSFKQILSLNPFDVRAGNRLTESALPIKFIKVHVINVSRFVEMAYTMFKKTMSDEFASRIEFYGSNLAKFYEQVPQEYLPEELGGDRKYPELSESKLQAIDNTLRSVWAV